MTHRAAWMTDIHLNFVAKNRVCDFADDVRRLGIDSVLVGGDIGEAPNFAAYLEELAGQIAKPCYFVLGNHDFYRGSIAAVRDAARRLSPVSRAVNSRAATSADIGGWLVVPAIAALATSTASTPAADAASRVAS